MFVFRRYIELKAKVSDLFSIDSLASLQPMYIVFSVRSNTKLLVFQSWPHHERVDVLRSALCCANKWNVVTTEFIHSRDANVSDTCMYYDYKQTRFQLCTKQHCLDIFEML